MAGKRAGERLQRLVAVAGRIERDGVDIGIAGVVRRKLGRLAQFGKRLAGSLQADEGEAQRIVQPGVLRRSGERRPQHRLAIAVAQSWR